VCAEGLPREEGGWWTGSWAGGLNSEQPAVLQYRVCLEERMQARINLWASVCSARRIGLGNYRRRSTLALASSAGG
jgi:hypothetical protein